MIDEKAKHKKSNHRANHINHGSDHVMQGWEIKKLGEVAEILNGGTPKTNIAEYWDGDIQWITPADLGKLAKPLVSNTPRKISSLGLEKSSAKLFRENSVILSTRAPIGHLAINEVPMSTNQGCRGIVPNKKLDTWYLYYFLKKNVELLNSLGTGATFKELSTKALAGVEIPIPPLPEQQRIVSILDECFAAIDKAKANVKQNLKNAKEVFESYLQEVFENGNWEKKTLKNVAKSFGRGKSKHRPRNWEGLYGGNYPFIQTGEVRNANKYISSYIQTYNEVGLAQSKLWKKGTICITIAANIAETAILDFDACIPDSIIGFEVDEKKADSNFAYYLLQYFKSELQKLGKGSAQDNINLGTFENQYFPFPPIKEQQAIVRQLDALRAETQKLEAVYQKKINNLDELKKSILQKVFSGELKTEKAVKV